MNTDPTIAAVAVLLWTIAIAGLYVWTSLALAAVFRKSGEDAWKAWVPIWNQVVLLQLGGLSGWLVLLNLLPIAGWIVLVVACHSVGRAFGFGGGMTVLAAVLLPLWASIIGFGSARWLGAGAGPQRTGIAPDDLDERSAPPVTAAPSAPAAPPASAVGRAPATPQPAPAPAASRPAATPVDADGPASGWAPPPVPTAPVAALRSPAPDEAGLSPLTDTGEVTAAVEGAPAPISALPFAPASAGAAASETPAAAPIAVAAPSAPVAAAIEDDDAVDDDDRLPGPARRGAAMREPWMPARTPMPEDDAFSDTSAEVSAIVGAPDAGAPRAARSSVSAQNRRPEIPEEPLEETIIARRKRAEWSLVGPSGEEIALASRSVLLGRRPSADPAHPEAQLVAIDDGTISRTHALLELRADAWFITDLGSTNGVALAAPSGAETDVTPGEAVEAGDRFLLGDAEIRIVRSGR